MAAVSTIEVFPGKWRVGEGGAEHAAALDSAGRSSALHDAINDTESANANNTYVVHPGVYAPVVWGPILNPSYRIMAVPGAKPGEVVVDGGGTQCCIILPVNVYYSSGINMLQGLTLRNGYVRGGDGQRNQGISSSGAAAFGVANFVDCLIEDCTSEYDADANAGGVGAVTQAYANNSILRLMSGCTMKRCRGLGSTGGWIAKSAIFHKCVFEDCVQDGAYATAHPGVVSNCTFIRNRRCISNTGTQLNSGENPDADGSKRNVPEVVFNTRFVECSVPDNVNVCSCSFVYRNCLFQGCHGQCINSGAAKHCTVIGHDYWWAMALVSNGFYPYYNYGALMIQDCALDGSVFLNGAGASTRNAIVRHSVVVANGARPNQNYPAIYQTGVSNWQGSVTIDGCKTVDIDSSINDAAERRAKGLANVRAVLRMDAEGHPRPGSAAIGMCDAADLALEPLAVSTFEKWINATKAPADDLNGLRALCDTIRAEAFESYKRTATHDLAGRPWHKRPAAGCFEFEGGNIPTRLSPMGM